MASKPLIATKAKGAVARAAAEVAQVIGEKPERVRAIDPKWATATTDGLVIELTIESGSFETPVRTMTDFGFRFTPELQEKWNKYVRSHGTKLIFPKEEIREVERLKGEMRNLLIDYSQSTVILKHGRLMPFGQAECARCGETNLKVTGKDADEWGFAPLRYHTDKAHKGDEPLGKERGWWYLEWKGKMDKLIEQYYAERDRLVGKWDELNKLAVADARLFADAAYANLLRDNNAPTDDQNEFYEQYVVRPLMRRFPSKSKMQADFKVEWSKGFLVLASLLAEDQAKARGILADERAMEIAAEQIAKAKTEVERDIIEARRAEIGKFRDFVSDMEGGVRTMLYDATIDALAIVDRRDGVLPSQTAERLADVLRSMKALQFGVADSELEDQMRKLRKAIAIAPRTEKQYTKSGADIAMDNLEKVAAGLRLALIEIGRPPATRREKLIAKIQTNGREQQLETEREFDPGERVGIPNSVETLREMAAGRIRRVRGSVEDVPTLNLTTPAASRRSRQVAEAVSA